MKRSIKALWAVAGSLVAGVALAGGSDVGVTVEISQPGVYGRIDLGRFPQPQVIGQRPIIVSPPRTVVVQPEPVYLWVPPGHQRHWRRHCGSYGACGVPVYFVREGWYRDHVWQRDDHDRRHGDRDERRGRQDLREDRRYGEREDRREDRGHGHGGGPGRGSRGD
jgi:hypothetical protein